MRPKLIKRQLYRNDLIELDINRNKIYYLCSYFHSGCDKIILSAEAFKELLGCIFNSKWEFQVLRHYPSLISRVEEDNYFIQSLFDHKEELPISEINDGLVALKHEWHVELLNLESFLKQKIK